MHARPLIRLRLTTAATEEIGATPHGILFEGVLRFRRSSAVEHVSSSK